MKYDVKKEHINIENYSPFSHINEVSSHLRKNSFYLPFIIKSGEQRPVHPDTFEDLKMEPSQIVAKKLVFPTSSFRTVYEPEEYVFYKLPLLRKITRGLRDLSGLDLERSRVAGKRLKSLPFTGFSFMPEECHSAEDPNFNYIKRTMPEGDREIFPWFYVIKSQNFSKEFEISSAKRIIASWMFFAAKDILLEYHTQNILVDDKANLCYRDLSDVRSSREEVLKPGYPDNKPINGSELLANVFDRTVCKQNLDHLFRYDSKLDASDRKGLKDFIESEIKQYNLPFPDYSIDFPKDSPERIPQKTELVSWRNFR